MIEFGADGFLYIAMGDGGSEGDPQHRAQDDRSLLGKILRIDVDTRSESRAYGIPPGNPFAASANSPTDPRPEIWHKGLRNPFRFSFDSANGDLYIGDVGGAAWEEIDASPNLPAINWGWNDREGRHCFEPMSGCLTEGRTEPVVEYSHGDGWASIIGGQVYRGSCFPDLVGRYFYGDYVKRDLWSFVLSGGVATSVGLALPAVGPITAIHADGHGELYVVTHDGRVGRLVVP
jgi:glucose/arabinose dehydrogenase